MKIELFNTEANNIWRKVTSQSAPDQLHVELDLHKKLLNFFQVGEYYYWVFNLTTFELDIVSNGVLSVLGYTPAEFSLQLLMDITHPDDRPWFLNYENSAAAFLKGLPLEKLTRYKVRYDFRLKSKGGKYVRLLHQSAVIEHDENGQLIRTIGVHTDITSLKPEGKPILSFIGLDGEPSYIDVDVEKLFTVSKEPLSKREKQILLLIMDGRSSKEISGMLNISKQTVDTHRNNMLAKNDLRNTGELIAKAIRLGWI